MKKLESLSHITLKDTYCAECKILRAPHKMACEAQPEELKPAFEKHEEKTKIHFQRLQQVFEPNGKPCPAIYGIIEVGEEALQAFAGNPALDARLVTAAQALEHCEIARFGTLLRWSQGRQQATLQAA